MIKFLWYCYFGLYVFMKTVCFAPKIMFLRKFKPEKADAYAFKIFKIMCTHVLVKSKTDLKVSGLENIPEGACVFAGNHEAIFDVFAVLPCMKSITGFIAKQSLGKLPAVAWWMRQAHSVFIDRDNPREGIKAINQAVENLKAGYSVIVFPEGTRSLKSEIAEFKRGSLKLALKANVPIVPFTVDGTYRVLEVGNKVRGNKAKIIFHEPIYVENLSREEQKNITEIVHDIVKKAL
ncbi:lysophospholipid acyltransferase family protein [Clostridium oryzae]|uniref:1-acyl-sn-glycerol-3-phosphate acyltransferase n=1 Tax=Clostridium oryzae TaxID=1450648 RepID=A0A1V4IPE5_9CLOT|nr:lysophospholipid acyltransferase family protein [Clostridium oryzae]OPJ61675.1 1-acyl-sn-glycerol-3-phosphate acyltransferase [Clostridium oryzae]